MTYREVVFSLKSGFKKIGLTQKLVLVLNHDSQKKVLTKKYLPHINGSPNRITSKNLNIKKACVCFYVLCVMCQVSLVRYHASHVVGNTGCLF